MCFPGALLAIEPAMVPSISIEEGGDGAPGEAVDREQGEAERDGGRDGHRDHLEGHECCECEWREAAEDRELLGDADVACAGCDRGDVRVREELHGGEEEGEGRVGDRDRGDQGRRGFAEEEFFAADRCGGASWKLCLTCRWRSGHRNDQAAV